MATKARMVDPRQPRFGQAITGTLLGAGFVLNWPVVIPVVAATLGAASLVGPRANPYAHLFRAIRGALGPPDELEEAAPPRFANLVGFLFTAGGTVALYGFGAPGLAWGLAVIVSALALLAAVTGLCVGCEAYVLARRILTRGRVARRVTMPAPEASR